jgi:uncharacterized protein YndB with AHSA1/START domain
MITHFAGEHSPTELRLDLTLDAPRAAVWRCWTSVEHLKQWYCPKPWWVERADIDVRPGGRFDTVFAGPNGERHDNKGAFLVVDPMRSLTFTDAYTEGFIPSGKHFMTGFVELSDAPGGKTRLIWGARHTSETDKQQHLDMGFVDGWKAAAAQLETTARAIAADKSGEFDAKTYLAIYIGSPASLNRKAYDALSPADRAMRDRQGMSEWGAWMMRHADALTLAGGPLGKTKRVTKTGIADTSNEMVGVVVLRAPSHDAAAQMFENHPHFTIFPGDAVEVMEILPVPGA